MNINRMLIYLSVVLSIGAFAFSAFTFQKEKHIYFVNNGKLYDNFKLKIEYESQIKTIRSQRKNMIDSIELTLRQLELQNRNDEFKIAQGYYIEKVKKFEEEEEVLIQEYNQQIWKRLNQYAVDFSKEKGIDILLGASGDGNLLHADDQIDMTKELIAYANNRYAGK